MKLDKLSMQNFLHPPRGLHRHHLFAGVVAVVIVGAGLGFGIFRSQAVIGDKASVGAPAPDFSGQILNGNVVTFSYFQGHPTVLVFWSGWCSTKCSDALSGFEALYRQKSQDGLIVVGMHRTQTELRQVGEEQVKSLGLTFPMLFDTTGDVYRTYVHDGASMPTAIFIDAKGIIRGRLLGKMTSEQIKAEIEKIL